MAFTVAAAFLLLNTLKATQDMAKDTRRIGEAQVRAHLGASYPKVKIHKVSEGEVEWHCVLNIKNTGHSAASLAEAEMQTNTSGFSTITFIGDIAAGATAENAQLAFAIPTEEIDWADDENARISFQIALRYSDIFGKTHTTPLEYDGVSNVVEGQAARLWTRIRQNAHTKA